jgi:hypothetical protein
MQMMPSIMRKLPMTPENWASLRSAVPMKTWLDRLLPQALTDEPQFR